MRISLRILVVSGFLLGACSRNQHGGQHTPAASASGAAFGPLAELDPSAGAAAVSPLAPSSPLPVVDGAALLQKIKSSGHRGVLVNAWASWCDPCQHELPMLSRVGPKLAAEGVPIWLVSVDDPDGFPAARALLDSLHIDLPSFAAQPPLAAFKIALNPKWPGMIPVSFLFDATGKLRYFWAGEVYEKELVPVVEGFLAGKHIDGVSDFGTAPGATQGDHE
ncbi:MAG: TlpA disulfide reductase family protein [Polyangiaceae bacterium]